MSRTKKAISYIYNPANQSEQELIANFVVRQREFQEIFQDIKTAPMQTPEQHYIVQGPRGSGKTTLLLRLSYAIKRNDELNTWLIPVIFCEEQYGVDRLARLWEKVIEILDEQEEFAGLYEELERTVDCLDDEDPCFCFLSETLQRKEKKVILFIDNIGDLLDKFSEQDQHLFRERLMTSADIRIIGASSKILEHTYDYSKPFF